MTKEFLNSCRNYVTDTNTTIMEGVSYLGSQLFLVPAWLSLLVIFYFVEKNKWYLVKVFTISLSTLLLMSGLKVFSLTGHDRLSRCLKQVPGLSFPSGHAFMSFVFYGMLIYIVYLEVKNKWLKGFTLFCTGPVHISNWVQQGLPAGALCKRCFGGLLFWPYVADHIVVVVEKN